MDIKQAEIITAIITPFKEDGHIDYPGLEKLTEHLLETGSQGFVIGGTTGESATLTHNEKIELYKNFVRIINGRVPIIAGTGSNNTVETIEFTNEVARISGIDCALIVAPYYNKPNQRGIKAHFKALTDQCDLPLMIYNIPGRTGITIENQTIIDLAHNSKIIGVKQCTSLEDIAELIEKTPASFAVYTGEDAQSLAAKAIGANGVISVASHIYGSDMEKMYQDFNKGEVKSAGKIQRLLIPKMEALFMYPSPSPVKAVLNAQGFGVGGCRLPIVDLNEEEKSHLASALNLRNIKNIPRTIGVNE